tara:strand:- start:516 stop:887 length:372 start_codon:yes stop_codon:yes gene_type:complete
MKQNIISPNPNVLIKDMNQVEFLSFMINTVNPTMIQHQLDNLDQVMDQTTEVIEKVMPRAIKIAENAIDQAIGPDDRSAEEIISDERQEHMNEEEPHLTFDEREQHRLDGYCDSHQCSDDLPW